MKSSRLPILFGAILLCTACTVKLGDGSSVTSEPSVSSASSVYSSSSIDEAKTISSLSSEALDILKTTANLNVSFLERLGSGSVHLRTMQNDGLHTVTSYNEVLPDQSVAQTYLFGGNNFYISGIGTKGFTVVTESGTDETGGYSFLENKKFPIAGYLRIDNDHYAYGIHPADTSSGANAGIHIQSIPDKSEKYLSNHDAGFESGLNGLVPLCLSADGQSLYIRYQPWEGFSYEAIWKLHLSDMHLEKIFGFDDKIYQYNCHNHSDLIVAVRTEQKDSYGMGGTSWSPSAVLLFDGAHKTSKVLASSDQHLFSDVTVSPDGQKIIGIERTAKDLTAPPEATNYDSPFYVFDAVKELFIMNLDGSDKHVVGSLDRIDGMSSDAKVIVGSNWADSNHNNYRHFIIDTVNGRQMEFGSGADIEPVSCSYGTGFDCNYR